MRACVRVRTHVHTYTHLKANKLKNRNINPVLGGHDKKMRWFVPSDCLVLAFHYHPINVIKIIWNSALVEGHWMSFVPLSKVATFITSSFSVFHCLKTLLFILLLRI